MFRLSCKKSTSHQPNTKINNSLHSYYSMDFPRFAADPTLTCMHIHRSWEVVLRFSPNSKNARVQQIESVKSSPLAKFFLKPLLLQCKISYQLPFHHTLPGLVQWVHPCHRMMIIIQALETCHIPPITFMASGIISAVSICTPPHQFLSNFRIRIKFSRSRLLLRHLHHHNRLPENLTYLL
jgi:hypothetical protein